MRRSEILFLFLSTIGVLYAARISSNEAIQASQEITFIKRMQFEQYLNHFDPVDNRTFSQRYFVDDRFFKPGGPLLIQIGAEGAISESSLSEGQSYILAQKLNGTLILLEHRFYGLSRPFEQTGAQQLSYLSVEQALEDLAYFVESVKISTAGLENSKVGVFGCSYGAALATWFRYKFPHLVDAAWASSGPLRATADFHEYYEVAMQVYANASRQCYDTIKEGYEETRNLLSTPDGEEIVRNRLKNWECGNISDTSNDDILTNIRYVLADHNAPPNHGVESCKLIKAYGQTRNLTNFDRLVDFVLTKSPDVCVDESSEDVNDDFMWTYQTCTEFGYYLTASDEQPFHGIKVSPIREAMDECVQQFGDSFNYQVLKRGIERINRVYGSTTLKVTRVLSVHGSQDPWHKLGLYRQLDPESPVIFIHGTSHCADTGIEDDAPPQLRRAKNRARRIMSEWLQ